MNQHLLERLAAIRGLLVRAHAGGAPMSAASRGAERESFIGLFLNNVIAPPFRIGTGDATDALNSRSGQLDIVIEYAVSISFPLMKPDGPRLYLAEGICAAIEVKSNLAAQWEQFLGTSDALSPLQRTYGMTLSIGGSGPNARIPMFAVGYEGWQTPEPLKERVERGDAAGILVLNSGLYWSRNFQATGDLALYGFLLDLEAYMSSMIGAKPSFAAYCQ